MSSQALTELPNKDGHPSKAFTLAGNNTVTPLNPAPGQFQAILVNIQLTPGQGAKWPMVQLPQQPTTTNVPQPNITINNNTIINHYNFPPQEPPKHGSHENSRARFDQSLQQATPQSRPIENAPSGVNTSSSKLHPEPTAHPKGHDGAAGTPSSSGSSHRAQEQSRQTQHVPRLETDSVRTRSANVLAASGTPQEGMRNSASNVTYPRAQGQVHQQKAQLEKKETNGLLKKVFRSHSDRGNTSKQRTNMSTSTDLTPLRGTISSHFNGTNPNGSREKSVIKRSQGYGSAQPPQHQKQAPSESTSDLAPVRQMPGPSHGHSQSKRHDGAAGTPQGQPAVDPSTSEVATALSRDDILKHLGKFNELLAGSPIDTKGDPVKLILIGKSSAEVMNLEKPKDVQDCMAYHIDVIISETDKTRRDRVEKELTRNWVFKPLNKKAYKSFFDKKPAEELKKLEEAGKCFFEKTQLHAFVMDKPDALKFERSRRDDRASKMVVTALERACTRSATRRTNIGA